MYFDNCITLKILGLKNGQVEISSAVSFVLENNFRYKICTSIPCATCLPNIVTFYRKKKSFLPSVTPLMSRQKRTMQGAMAVIHTAQNSLWVREKLEHQLGYREKLEHQLGYMEVQEHQLGYREVLEHLLGYREVLQNSRWVREKLEHQLGYREVL